MKRTIVFFQAIIILLFTILLIYNLREITVFEKFTSSIPVSFPINVWNTEITSTNVYNKNASLMCETLRYASNYLGDSNDIFQMRYCLEKKHNADLTDGHAKVIEEMVGSLDMYVQTIHKDTTQMSTLREDVERLLFNFKQGRKVQGPVFAILAQAPYYIDNKDVLIHHQPFNKKEYLYSPTLPHKVLPYNGIRITMHLLFPMYRKDKTLVKIATDETRKQMMASLYSQENVNELVRTLYADTSNRFKTETAIEAEVKRRIQESLREFDSNTFKSHLISRLQPIQQYKSNSDMCKIHCIGDTGLLCGCKNQNAPYTSRCMGRLNATDMQNTDYHDYMIFYRLNEKSEKLKRYFTFSYYEDVAL
jgi:hypothetical protein